MCNIKEIINYRSCGSHKITKKSKIGNPVVILYLGYVKNVIIDIPTQTIADLTRRRHTLGANRK